MPRCGCAGSTCSCLITAGPGVQITGSGQASNPYVITATAATIAGTIAVLDTETVDLTLLGEGTLAQPYVITATATIEMDDLLNVDAAAPPTGYVLGFDGANWVPVPASTVDPGLITTGPGITGDGSAALPLAAEVSATWGTAPLDIYGADSLNGLETYIDSAGQIRTRGANLAPDVFAQSDPFTAWPLGETNMPVDTAGDWPILSPATSGLVVTIRREDRAEQWVFRNSQTLGGAAYYRHGSAAGWTPWRNAAALFGLATGTVGLSGGANESRTATVTYPVGRFTAIPLVQLTSRTSTNNASTTNTEIVAVSLTTASFQAFVNRSNATAVTLDWLATQEHYDDSPALFAAADVAEPLTQIPETATCGTAGCENEGIGIPIDGGWVDEDGAVHPVGIVICGACGQEITDVVEA